jgi:transposase
MAKTFREYEPDQLLLMPPSLRDWLPEDHLVYFVSDLVERLDLSEILDSYDEERGYPPYHPVMMTKLLLYGYAVGIRSSRKLQQGTREHVAFRVLCAGNEPDFRTIAAFRTRHVDALEGLFVQVLNVCTQAGMAKLGTVAIDGTKIKANASKHKAMSYGRMKKERRRLRAQIHKYLRECEQVDAEEDALYGADKLGDELPEELADAARRLEKIDEAMASLREEAAAEAKAKGKRPKAPEDKAQRNFTDPESRIMKAPDKSFVQAYNGQLAVDADSQVIVAKALLQQANDKNQLVPMVHQTVDNVGLTPETVVADSGYWVGRQVERIEYYDIEPLVATRKIRHREWRETPVLEGPMPEGLNTRDKMEWKLKTEDGRRKMMQRWSSVEPVNGQIKQAMGFRQFLLRGHRKANGEWTLVCTAHNVLKLFRAGAKLSELVSGGPPASPQPAGCAA